MLFYDLFRHDPTVIEIKQGNTLFKEGEVGSEMYVLIEGQAEVHINGVFFETCQTGAMVGEMAVIDDSPRYATVTAVSDCKFVVVDKKHFHFLVDETPGFAIEIMRILANRLKMCDLRVIKCAEQQAQRPT